MATGFRSSAVELVLVFNVEDGYREIDTLIDACKARAELIRRETYSVPPVADDENKAHRSQLERLNDVLYLDKIAHQLETAKENPHYCLDKDGRPVKKSKG